MSTLLLNQKEINDLVSMDDVLEIVEKTFKGMGEGTVINPAKLGLDLGETGEWPPYKGFMNAMPAYVGWLDTAGMKWVGGFLDNGKAGIPYLSGMILLIDPRNGQFLCVMEGALITNMRTGAQTAIALRHMHPGKSITLGLYGAGTQGRTQVHAISRVFAIERLIVYDINREAAEQFKADMGKAVHGEIVLARTAEEAAKGDAVISVTQAKEKFIKDSWIEPGTILFPMGSYQECEDQFILGADRIVVDHVEQCMHRGAMKALASAGKIAPANVFATIGEIVAGKKRVPDLRSERVLCIPVGTGAMDVAVATVAMRRAREKGLGSSFDFS
jgi:alanine dehydrogenase